MRRLILLLVALIPMTVFAEGLDLPEADGPNREEVARRIRTMRAVALANQLELDEKTALTMNAVLRDFDERRDRIHEGAREHMEIVRRAAGGADTDRKTVDAAIEALLGVPGELARLRAEEAHALLRHLEDPQKRARLIVFLQEFPKEVRKMMHRHRKEMRRRR